MNYEDDVKEIRKGFIEKNLPEKYREMKENDILSEYLKKIELEYYDREESIYDDLYSQELKSKKKSLFFGEAERLTKEVELKIKAKDQAAKEVLFRETL